MNDCVIQKHDFTCDARFFQTSATVRHAAQIITRILNLSHQIYSAHQLVLSTLMRINPFLGKLSTIGEILRF